MQTAFDHNFSQDLDLQQIYGGGIGWTFLKTPKQEADLKATVQYEKQSFISGDVQRQPEPDRFDLRAPATCSRPSWSPTPRVFRSFPPTTTSAPTRQTKPTPSPSPRYKNLSFSLGTMDSYLNDPPASLPPTKRNSFQFTMGMTYAIKSKD